jgi:hypothetical protein
MQRQPGRASKLDQMQIEYTHQNGAKVGGWGVGRGASGQVGW